MSVTPRPYQIDDPSVRIQTREKQGDQWVLLAHDLTRLDRDNFHLLTKREKDANRMSERLGKGRTRHHSKEPEADAGLYQEIIVGGGWRPDGLEKTYDLDSLDAGLRELYEEDEQESGLFVPTGWFGLPVDRMRRLNLEFQSAAIQRYLQCSGEFVPAKFNIDFMFEEAGTMRMRLNIGDPDLPAYRLLLDMRRPESSRRSNFRDSFAYSVDTVKGDAGKSEMVIRLDQGVSLFDEQFLDVVEDPEYSPVVFRDKRTNAQRQEAGEDPRPVSAVGDQSVAFTEFVPYDPSRKGDFLRLLNPIYKVEVASAVVLEFNSRDRELQRR